VSDETGVRHDAHDGAVEHRHGFAAAPLVGGFVQWQFDAIGKDAGDFHSVEMGV
jgi:hypothetical protein